jgi:hypothetical protein
MRAMSAILIGLLLGGCSKELELTAEDADIAWDCGGTVLGYASKDSGYESGSGANENDSDVTLWVINPSRGPVVIKLHTTAHAFSTWDAEVNGKPCRRKVLD